MREIANHDLTPADIPAHDADWDTVAEFALTFNPELFTSPRL